jgi:thioredoxin-related protein
MQKVKLSILYLLALLITSAREPSSEQGQVHWLTLDEASAHFQKDQRPILIDLYTDWCGWCKTMDHKTYMDKRVADYLNNKFYPVRLNAETKNQISWNNKVYEFNANYRANDFAIYLTGGRLEFPTTIFIPYDGMPQAIPGYMPPKDFELLVKYFGEKAYGQIPFEVYRNKFKSSW